MNVLLSFLLVIISLCWVNEIVSGGKNPLLAKNGLIVFQNALLLAKYDGPEGSLCPSYINMCTSSVSLRTY